MAAKLICPKCGSEDVQVQVITETKLRDDNHGCLWWICVGWWWIPCKWIFLTVPALLAAIFIPKKQKAVTKERRKCVCQHCGHTWDLR